MFKEYFKEYIVFNEGNTPVNSFTIGFELEAWSNEWSLKEDFNNWALKFWKNEEQQEVKENKSSSIRLNTISMGDDYSIDPDDDYYDNITECPECYGSGLDICPECDGDGYIKETNDEGDTVTVPCPECNGEGDITCSNCNGSGYVELEEEDDRIFEWSSPVLNLTPINLQRIINFLNYGVEAGYINTNESCGFHIHIGFPDVRTRSLDMFWILCQIAAKNKEEMFKKILEFKGIELINKQYAKPIMFEYMHTNFISMKQDIESEISAGNKDIREFIKYKFEYFFKQFYNDEKYTILRQHPQGTLEWRGARGFLDSKKRNDIKQFLLTKLYPFVKWISDMLDEDKISFGNFYITRKEFNEIFKKFNAPSQTANRKDMGIVNKFNADQDLKIITDIYKQLPWLNKCNFENMKFVYENDKIVAQYGIFLSGDIYCDTVKCNFENDSKVLAGIHKNSKFLNNSTFANGKAYNCNFYDNSTFANGEAYNCNFTNGRCTITDGKFENCDIDETDIFGGNFNNCSFIDSSVHNGKFTNCKWDFYNKGEWINGIWENGKIIQGFDSVDMYGLDPNEYRKLNKKIKAMPVIGQRDYTKMPNPKDDEDFDDYMNRVRNKR